MLFVRRDRERERVCVTVSQILCLEKRVLERVCVCYVWLLGLFELKQFG